MRNFPAFLIFAILFQPFASPVRAGELAPSGLIKTCTFDSPRDRANCQSFYHGVVEPFQVNATDPTRAPCRKEALSSADITSFLNYSQTHMLPDTSEGAVQILTYLASPPGMGAHVPCADVAGIWTSGQVSALCKLEDGESSPCKFYLTGLLESVKIQAAIQKTSFFCPKGEPVRPEDEVLNHFTQWLGANPSRAAIPAASGFVDALRQAYPC